MTGTPHRLSSRPRHSVSEPYSGVLYISRRAKPAINGKLGAFDGVVFRIKNWEAGM